MSLFHLFDQDGATRPPYCGGGNPLPPPRPLGAVFHAIRRRNPDHLLVAATGTSLGSVRKTEQQLAFRYDWLAFSYCVRIIRRGGHTPTELTMVPEAQKVAMSEVTPGLDVIRFQHPGANLDDRGLCYTMYMTQEGFQSAARAVEALVGSNPNLRWSANGHDGGITVIPANAGKALLMRYLREQGASIGVAAGDTGSDAPMLEEAVFPIATRTQLGAAINPKLLEIIERKGVGYVAKEDEPDGKGLLAGLHAARSQGILTF